LVDPGGLQQEAVQEERLATPHPEYRNVEADATLAAFADSDWEQSGGAGNGTNVKGFEAEYVRMLSDKVQGAVSLFHIKPEDGSNETSDRFFIDFSTKF